MSHLPTPLQETVVMDARVCQGAVAAADCASFLLLCDQGRSKHPASQMGGGCHVPALSWEGVGRRAARGLGRRRLTPASSDSREVEVGRRAGSCVRAWGGGKRVWEGGGSQ
jgi:hypothetical protein